MVLQEKLWGDIPDSVISAYAGIQTLDRHINDIFGCHTILSGFRHTPE
jgi:hypothetical protein